MSTNPLERIPKRSPKTNVTDLNEFAKTAGSTAASAAYPIMLGLTGEDTGDEWYEDLAYGAVPGGALVQRAKTGTIPGLLDMLPGDLGAGARLAMLPIAKFGAEEITKGAARMGKSARNTEKALAKESGDSPYVFYHRTSKDHVDDIKREGLNRNSRNKGENTWDSDELPDVNWLSPSPSNIPVLRWPLYNKPETVAQFKVTLPRDFYDNAIKYHFPDGRGYGTAEMVKKGDFGISQEDNYPIIMLGDDVPPQFLEEMPLDEVRELVKAEDNTENLINILNGTYSSVNQEVLDRMVREHPDLFSRMNRVADNEWGDIEFKKVDRSLGDELNSMTIPVSERYENNSKSIEEGLELANQRIAWLNDGNRDYFEEGTTPYSILHDELRRLQIQAGMDDNGDIVKKKYYRPESKVTDLYEGEATSPRRPDIFEVVPGPGKIQPGAVSRGLTEDTSPRLVDAVRQLYNRFGRGGKTDTKTLREAIKGSANPTKTLEFLLNSENVGDVVENMLTTTNYGHIGRVPYTADARRDGLQAIYKRTLPGIYNVSYRESIDNGATDAEARKYALDAVKYWMKERSAEGITQGHTSVGDLISP